MPKALQEKVKKFSAISLTDTASGFLKLSEVRRARELKQSLATVDKKITVKTPSCFTRYMFFGKNTICCFRNIKM